MGITLKNKPSIFTIFKEYSLMAFGMFLYSFGWICCILPADAAGGGASGISLLIYHITGGAISVGTMVLIINAILLIIAGFVVGWNFGIKTIYCVVVMSVIMHFLQMWFTAPDGWVAQEVVASTIKGFLNDYPNLAQLLSDLSPNLSTETVDAITNLPATLSNPENATLANIAPRALPSDISNNIVIDLIGKWKEGAETLPIKLKDILPNIHGESKPIVDVFRLDNRLLSAILGGICSGVGVAICFQQGGSTGGSDIVVMIVNKFYTISYGKFIRYTDGVIISSALFLPEIGIDGVIYGFVMVAEFSYTVDMILSGNQQSSQIFIVSKDYKAVADAINNEAKRGATVIDAMGWYSKDNSKVVMCVCRKRDLAMVLKVVRSVDPDAFITIGSVMGVYGKGFDALNKI